MPKSMTLACGLPSCIDTRMFDGLMSRWMIPFWCACWIALQTWTKSSSRCLTERLSRVAERRDRLAGDELHHEERPSGGGGAGVEHLGDVGVVHHRQGLALLLEAGDDLLGVHPQLDDLERDAPRHRLALLGQEDGAEAARADHLEQRVTADHRAGAFGEGGEAERRQDTGVARSEAARDRPGWADCS